MIKLKKWSAGRNRYSRNETFFDESQLEHYLAADIVVTVGLSSASRRLFRYSYFDDFSNHLRFGGRIEKHPFFK